MGGRGAAAASDDVDQAVEAGDLCRHLFRRLVIASHLVGKPGVGVADDGHGTPGRQTLYQGQQFCCAQRAVEAESQQGIVADGGEIGFQGLAGEGASAPVADGNGNHHRESRMHLLDAVQGRFCVEGVKGGFQEEKVHPAFDQGLCMGGVRLCHLVKIVLPPGGAGKIGTKGKRLGTGSHAPGHPDLSRSGIGHLPGQLCADAGILRRMLSQNVERVGFQDIGSSIYIGLVDGFDNVRVREVQILSGLQAMLLDLCAHGSVQPEHTGGKFVFNHCQSKDIEKIGKVLQEPESITIFEHDKR